MRARRQGFVRVRVDGEMVDIADAPKLDKYKRHSIEVVVDRYIVRHAEAPDGAERAPDGRPIDPETGAVIPDPDAGRLADSVETALRLGEGVVLIAPGPAGRRGAGVRGAALQREVQLPVRRLHGRRARAAQLLVQLAARRLPACTGLGHEARDRSRPGHPGPVEEPGERARSCPWARMPTDASWRLKILEAICAVARLGLQGADPRPAAARRSTTSSCAAKDEKVVVRYRHERGENTYKATFEGVVTNLERRYRETDSDYIKTELEKYMVTRPCPVCARQAAAAGDPRRSPSASGTSGTSRRCRSPTRSTGRPG